MNVLINLGLCAISDHYADHYAGLSLMLTCLSDGVDCRVLATVLTPLELTTGLMVALKHFQMVKLFMGSLESHMQNATDVAATSFSRMGVRREK